MTNKERTTHTFKGQMSVLLEVWNVVDMITLPISLVSAGGKFIGKEVAKEVGEELGEKAVKEVAEEAVEKTVKTEVSEEIAESAAKKEMADAAEDLTQKTAKKGDVLEDSSRVKGNGNSKWWHENYVDNLSDVQILLGVKQADKGLSTLGSATKETAMSAGKAWVGDSYNVISDSSGNIIGYSSSDGMRAFRIQYKPKENMWRANFQENIMVNNPYPNPGQHSSQLKNVHIDILD